MDGVKTIRKYELYMYALCKYYLYSLFTYYGSLMIYFIFSLSFDIEFQIISDIIMYIHNIHGYLIIILQFSILYVLSVRSFLRNIYDKNYYVILIKDLLSSKDCDKIKSICENQITNDIDIVIEIEGTKEENLLKRNRTTIDETVNPVAYKMLDMCSLITGYPINHMERVQYIKYDEGGFLCDHYDPHNHFDGKCKDRIFTIIFYLDDVEEGCGGETYFREIDTYIRPVKGNCLVFKNLTNSNELLMNSLHCSIPLNKGVKTICTVFVHMSPF